MKNKVDKLLTLVKDYNATLIGVSKRIPIDKILQSLEYGITHLGESRVQELAEKFDTFSQYDISTHFIGHLQSNKARKCVEMSNYIHTVDSLKKAKTVNRIASECNKKPKIFVQVNVSDDDNKHGLSVDEYYNTIDKIVSLDHIETIGLMTIGLKTPDTTIIANYYKQLRLILEETRSSFDVSHHFKELSMGMSSDYKIALDEGSTFIRVGTGIYGERSY